MADRVPFLWWTTGLAASTIMSVAILATMFNMNVGTAILALLLGFMFSFIGVQSAGTTDVNPVSTVAKVSRELWSSLQRRILTETVRIVGYSTHLWWYRKGHRSRPSPGSDAELGCRCRRRWFRCPGYRHDW